uniref:MAK10-like protein n=1 Tax=Tanacetum cinerariifolium TaxID=118510 RepID=A0A6L2NGS3_TANCI|nr:MAK10-like protein [Tanacetum cinerariifolium]
MGGSYYPIPCSILSTGRTVKLCNDIMMFQQHHRESPSEAWIRFKDLLQKVPHHAINLWLQAQIFYDHVNPVTRRTIDQSVDGKLRDLNPKESQAILEDLSLYDNESWNDPRDFAKPVKAIALPQDVSSTSDRRLIELENQVQRLMEAHLTPTRPTHVNKITTPCEICSGIPMVPKSIAAISHDEREELKKKGIKSPSKLLSPQYLSPASIKELNKNPSAPNCVHFVNSIVILSTKNDTDEDDTSSTSIHEHKLDDMMKGSEEKKEQSKEEDGIETDMEVEEVIEE